MPTVEDNFEKKGKAKAKQRLDLHQEPVVLLINTKARHGQPKLERARKALGAAGVNLVQTHAFSDSRQLAGLAQQVVRAGIKVLVVASGDGTISHVVDYLVDHDVTLGILPLGTANNLARTLQIPLQLEQACQVLAEGWTTRIDLGLANGNYFVNAAMIGWGAEVIKYVTPGLKRRLGTLAYVLAAARAGFTNRPFRVRLLFPDREIETQAIHIVVSNGRSFGGGIVVAPGARIDDRQMVVTVFERLNLIELGQVVLHLRDGRYVEHPRIQLFRKVTRLRLEVATGLPKPVNLDGDLSEVTPVEFSLAPAALRVIVPQHYGINL